MTRHKHTDVHTGDESHLELQECRSRCIVQYPTALQAEDGVLGILSLEEPAGATTTWPTTTRHEADDNERPRDKTTKGEPTTTKDSVTGQPSQTVEAGQTAAENKQKVGLKVGSHRTDGCGEQAGHKVGSHRTDGCGCQPFATFFTQGRKEAFPRQRKARRDQRTTWDNEGRQGQGQVRSKSAKSPFLHVAQTLTHPTVPRAVTMPTTRVSPRHTPHSNSIGIPSAAAALRRHFRSESEHSGSETDSDGDLVKAGTRRAQPTAEDISFAAARE